MVDFLNANLCGASPELNDVLSKLDDAKADILAKINESASAAAAAFGEARNELEELKNKLQTIEIPAIPKLNLQAEIANLVSLVPGSPSFLSALAKLKLEFENDIKAAGLDLGTLIADATKAITGGGDLCALVPNLEKAAGSTDAATTKPAAVTQAAAKAISEAPSVIKQNVNVKKRVEKNKEKVESFTVTSTLPTADFGAFTIVPESLIENLAVFTDTFVREAPKIVESISGQLPTLTISEETSEELKTIFQDLGENLAKVVKPGSSHNVAPDGTGFLNKPDLISKIFSGKELAALQNHMIAAVPVMKGGIETLASDLSINGTTVRLDPAALNKIKESLPQSATNINAIINNLGDVVVNYKVFSNYNADMKI